MRCGFPLSANSGSRRARGAFRRLLEKDMDQAQRKGSVGVKKRMPRVLVASGYRQRPRAQLSTFSFGHACKDAVDALFGLADGIHLSCCQRPQG